jgi:hypothetical protein
MLLDLPEFIARVPIERRDDGELTAAGVQIRAFTVGHIPARLYAEIDRALNAKAAAEGRNMPVALDPDVWLLKCRRCGAPFIGLQFAKLCSDACRVGAKRDAVARFKAKRAERAWREPSKGGQIVCLQCGRLREGWSRSNKRFCSVRCRVAAHRGRPAQPMDVEALDYEIKRIEEGLGAMALVGGFGSLALGYGRRLTALKAERAKLDAASS